MTKRACKEARYQAVGTTGYGRFLVGKEIRADLIQEELTVNSKGAVFLADRQHGPATVIDIGGMDNKAISVMDGIPGVFTMGGICAGASGRFLEMTAKRLGVDITELGPLSMKGFGGRVPMNSYCIVFGTQSLVNALAAGSTREDVAAAACHSVAEQVFEQQLQEVDIKEPVDHGRGDVAHRGARSCNGRAACRRRSSYRTIPSISEQSDRRSLHQGLSGTIRCLPLSTLRWNAPNLWVRSTTSRSRTMSCSTTTCSK